MMDRLSKEHLGVIEQDPAIEDIPKLMGHIGALEAENARLRQALEFEEQYARTAGAFAVADRIAEQLCARVTAEQETGDG